MFVNVCSEQRAADVGNYRAVFWRLSGGLLDVPRDGATAGGLVFGEPDAFGLPPRKAPGGILRKQVCPPAPTPSHWLQGAVLGSYLHRCSTSFYM